MNGVRVLKVLVSFGQVHRAGGYWLSSLGLRVYFSGLIFASHLVLRFRFLYLQIRWCWKLVRFTLGVEHQICVSLRENVQYQDI